MNATRTVYGFEIEGVPHVPLEDVLKERERCAGIVENLHRMLSTPYVDPDPKYRTNEAKSHLDKSLTEIALEAIRNP